MLILLRISSEYVKGVPGAPLQIQSILAEPSEYIIILNYLLPLKPSNPSSNPSNSQTWLILAEPSQYITYHSQNICSHWNPLKGPIWQDFFLGSIPVPVSGNPVADACEISVDIVRSEKILWDPSRSCEISVNLVRSQKILWDLSRSCEILVDLVRSQ